MCLGLPGRVVSVEDGGARAQVDVVGTLRLIDLRQLTGPVTAGDHILIHSGIALQRISVEQAAELGELFRPPPRGDAAAEIIADGPAPTKPPGGTSPG